MSQLVDAVFEEILSARQRVYAVGSPTPLDALELPDIDAVIYAKREDVGPIKAYKWRGAYNCMAKLSPELLAKGVVAASAGNHGQGVALAASKLGCKAYIFMPRSTPEVKQQAVRNHGGEFVTVELIGDSYDAASMAAKAFAKEKNLSFVHPYDDLGTMGGQGTLADEVLMSGKGPFDRVYLQIGGGGLAASSACWFRHFWPDCKIFGVEGKDQASMKLAIDSQERKSLDYVDVFCDGTAVRLAGELTYQLCNELLDEVMTVSNVEVCQSMRMLWNALRVIPEPSGAMGLAGLVQDWDAGRIKKGEKCLIVISGANMDFAQLARVASRAGIREANRSLRYLRLPMKTKRGQVSRYLQGIPDGIELRDVQFGRTNASIQYPVFGMLGTDDQFAQIAERLAIRGLKAEDVTHDADVRFRLISYDRAHLRHPVFFVIEFPERSGAFTEFMHVMGEYAHLCYFNYEYSGENVGRALVGFEFETVEDREKCRELAAKMIGTTIQGLHELPDTVRRRVLGAMSIEESDLC